MDVSRSMCSTDIPPNRLLAAEQAASSFVQRQGADTQIGIVAFAGFAEIVQAPTNDEEVLLDVIGTLATGPADGDRQRDPRVDRRDRRDRPVDREERRPERPDGDVRRRRVPKGAYAPAIIVLLTDGASNAGPDPDRSGASRPPIGGCASTRSASGPRTPAGGRRSAGQIGQRARRQRPVRPGRQLRRVRRRLRRDRRRVPAGDRRGHAQRVADATGGKYYPAESAEQLNEVFAEAPDEPDREPRGRRGQRRVRRDRPVLLALAILLGQRWRPLP